MSTDETTALICFYAARLDEDQAAADEAGSRPLGPKWDDGTRLTAVARHTNRHDPARVLREVERGRRLIERYTLAARAVQRGSVASFTAGQDSGYAEACLDAIKEAAAVHDGHPDYLPAFRPE
jgi:Family of unknown function (DUF6221)